ncbi:MAG: hypothetical protein ACLQIB_24070 [Isosphaeraceae bacterium]
MLFRVLCVLVAMPLPFVLGPAGKDDSRDVSPQRSTERRQKALAFPARSQ